MENSKLKFRAWDKNNKQMIYDYECPWFMTKETLLNTVFEADDIEFLQCTGLKDKNGTEIYEGDICIFQNCMPEKINGIGYVYWSGAGGYWGAKTILPFLLHKAGIIEVIGNKWENPELLKANHG
jgi:hypothetical protein